MEATERVKVLEEALEEKLGRYGHHPEPIIDFEVELESLENIWADRHITPLPEGFERRLDRALDFRPVVTVKGAMARNRLLALDEKVRAALTQQDQSDE